MFLHLFVSFGFLCMMWLLNFCILLLCMFSVYTDYVSGGEMFTHLYQRDHFPEEAVRIYIGEIILALEHLHKVGSIFWGSRANNNTQANLRETVHSCCVAT